MNALILQAKFGNFDTGKVPDVGVLDLVGKNRRHQWSLLKGMSKTEAMSKFICTLDEICPFFKAYAEAVKISSGLSPRHQTNIPTNQNGNGYKTSSPIESDEQLKAIHTSLCRQTYNQFKSYAEKQYPDDLPKQKYLISSLQEQYYQQYISQMHPELSNVIQANGSSTKSDSAISGSMPSSTSATSEVLICATPAEKDTAAAVDVSPILAQPITNPVVQSISSAIRMQDSKVTGDTSNGPAVQAIELTNYGGGRSDSPPRQRTDELVEAKERDAPLSNSSQTNIIKTEKQPNISDDINFKQNLPDGRAPESLPVDHQRSDTYGSYGNVNYSQSSSHNIEPQNIGTFESYPEPKPYQSTAQQQQQTPQQASFAINIPNFGVDTYNYNQKQSAQVQQTTSPYSVIQSELPIPQFGPLPLQPSSSDSYHHQSPIEPTAPAAVYNEPSQYNTEAGEISVVSPSDEHHVQRIIDQQPEVDSWSYGSSSGGGSPLQGSFSYEPPEQASIWTKKGVGAFKESLMGDKHGGIYEVKQGTLVVIQVPTYPDGRFVYFEFATDDYDIGFGLDFVYENNLAQPLALKIYEEDDEDDDDDDIEELNRTDKYDPESAGTEATVVSNGASTGRRSLLEKRRMEKFQRVANTVSIVPTYRRDSHEEVFVGRHKYPGQGYYLLKFDNTYSVLRSKSLYFRICYFI